MVALDGNHRVEERDLVRENKAYLSELVQVRLRNYCYSKLPFSARPSLQRSFDVLNENVPITLRKF